MAAHELDLGRAFGRFGKGPELLELLEVMIQRRGVKNEKPGRLVAGVPEGMRLASRDQDKGVLSAVEDVPGDVKLNDTVQDEVSLFVSYMAMCGRHPTTGGQCSLHERESTLRARLRGLEPHLAAACNAVESFTTFETEHNPPPRSVTTEDLDLRSDTSARARFTAWKNLLVNPTIPPGWHSDPGDASSLRWWDGTQWTEHRCPAPVAAPGSLPPGVVAPSRAPAMQAPAIQTPAVRSDYYAARQPHQSRGTGRARGPNSFSWTAIAFAVAYLVLALTTNFVLLGIVPVLSSVRAFQRGEKLAPVAAVAAAVTVGTAIYFFGFHHR